MPGVPYYQRLWFLCCNAAELFERRFDFGKHEMGEGPGSSAALRHHARHGEDRSSCLLGYTALHPGARAPLDVPAACCPCAVTGTLPVS